MRPLTSLPQGPWAKYPIFLVVIAGVMWQPNLVQDVRGETSDLLTSRVLDQILETMTGMSFMSKRSDQ